MNKAIWSVDIEIEHRYIYHSESFFDTGIWIAISVECFIIILPPLLPSPPPLTVQSQLLSTNGN